ncbi:hypothetical protein UFOVP240_95 [uncultured Caudovirales phage]|uniref:Uncharacterized protein n=1 Tax=uncultured Caudovirales phage TaxID=2100421 RepID=A0A6J7WWB6_9CAUD|nr:hypothetical protein UFOVP240_95 [uncultured Caudovirales phage]
MDPITLFALANGAVAAVKKGCALYKEIKGVTGDVKGILKDLDEQFHKKYEGKPVPPEAKKQLNEEKQRVQELSKQDPGDVYSEIGEQLGAYFDNMAKCKAVFDEEEKRSKNEIYSGDASLGKRALQRVLMRKKLEQMEIELRELMIYQSPPELGALWTEVNEMMEKLGKEQKVQIAKQMRIEQAAAVRRARQMQRLKAEMVWVFVAVFILLFWAGCIIWVVEKRKEDYPEYGQDFIPHLVTDHERIIAERNKKYWDKKAEEYRRQKR